MSRGPSRTLDASERALVRQLVESELGRLRRLARGLGSVDADDLVQDTLVRACRSCGSLRDPQAGRAWLRTILTNVWRDRARRDCRSPDEVPIDDESTFAPPRRARAHEPPRFVEGLHVAGVGSFSSHDVHVVLDRLPPRYRAPLVLRYLQGYDVNGVAELLDLPAGTVMSRLHRGRARFDRELRRYADESGAEPRIS